jgi:predicted transcriptional regulator
MAETVRIDPTSHALLAEMARAKHIPISEVLAQAVSAYRREQMFQALDAGYAELHANEAAWAEELTERAHWDGALADGLGGE